MRHGIIELLPLVQVMACCLFGAKPLSEPMMAICQMCLKKKIQLNFNQNIKIFIKENAFENYVC